MKQSFLIAVLFAAIFACQKDVPQTALGPQPRRPNGMVQASSTYDPLRGVDCSKWPPAPAKPGNGKSDDPRCKKDTVSIPPPGMDSCCR